MITPPEHGEAVQGIRFFAALSADGAMQVTMAEIKTMTAITIGFYVPLATSSPKDASGLLTAMGGHPFYCCTGTQASSSASTVAVSRFEDTAGLMAEVSGCPKIAIVDIPNAGTFECAWMHEAVPGYVFLPTQNENMSGWKMDAVVVGCDCKPYGKALPLPLNRTLRWDLATSSGLFTFGHLDRAWCVSQHSEALPFHNLYFPTTERDPNDRRMVGVSGAVVLDRTALHLVSCADVGFQLTPVVCGCFVRDAVNFAKAHVPVTITERMTRVGGPFTVDDGQTPGTIVARIGDKAFTINLLERDYFGGLTWLTLTRCR